MCMIVRHTLPLYTALSPTCAQRRIGAAAASTTVHAGHYRSNPPQTFCGVTAAVAPNRMLYAGIFNFSFYIRFHRFAI